MSKYIYIFLLCISFLNAQEISVFGAGDLNSASPYGLTKSEKAIYKNNQKIKDLKSDIKSLTSKLTILKQQINKIKTSQDDFSEDFDGFKSVYESDSSSLNKTRKNLYSIDKNIQNNKKQIIFLNTEIDKNSKSIIQLQNDIKNLQAKLTNFINLQEKNNQFVEQSLKEMSKVINTINQHYVSTKKFDELVKFINKQATKKKVIKKSKYKHKKKKIVKLSNKQKFDKAVRYYNKNLLTKSIPLWQDLIKAKYKLSISYYYLGNVRFYKKQYKKAISNYKSSMMIDDQASYIPKLLLNSAIAFDKMGDKNNANNFYNTLIDVYPQTKEAKIANKKINKE